MNTGRKALIGLGLGAYLIGLGMLTGVAIDRLRYARQRAEVLGRYEQALRDWQTSRALRRAGRRDILRPGPTEGPTVRVKGSARSTILHNIT